MNTPPAAGEPHRHDRNDLPIAIRADIGFGKRIPNGATAGGQTVD
jgi:hypothetical protein